MIKAMCWLKLLSLFLSGRIQIKLALVLLTVGRGTGDKPWSESMIVYITDINSSLGANEVRLE